MLTRDDLRVIAVATVGIALLGGIAAHELGNRPKADHYEIVEIARSAVPGSDTEKKGRCRGLCVHHAERQAMALGGILRRGECRAGRTGKR